MAVFLSPGVFPREIDLSVLPTGVGPLRPAVIGTAKKGPINEPIFISNAQQFIDTFGEPITDSAMGFAMLGYLEEGNQAFVLRVGVECEGGQPEELRRICIDTSGRNLAGWGRIPVFKGIDFGKICLRIPTTDDPFEFHVDDVFDIEYNDIDISSTDGPTDATLSFVGTGLSDEYTGAIDDSFIVLLTSDPTSGLLDGAEFEIIRNSDGKIVATGELVEGTPGESEPVAVGAGDDDSGLIFEVVVTGSSPLEKDDTFRFKVKPDNLTLSFEVEGLESSPASFSFTDGTTFTDAEAFADAFNVLVGAGPDFSAIATNGELCIKTDTAGERIQLTGSEAFALEVGVAKHTFDIPRSFILGNDPGPHDITTANNRINLQVIGTTSQDLEVSIPIGLDQDSDAIAAALDLGGIFAGERFYESFAIQVTDDDRKVVLVTSVDHQFDQLKMLADLSHVKTLRFAETLEILFPFTRPFRSFSDPRVGTPESSSIDPALPDSCETDPASDDCIADSAYFANIVGFFVAMSPGTWINDYALSLELFNAPGADTNDRFTVRITFKGVEVERLDDVSFDPREERYIANLINKGSTLGGVNGNAVIQWEDRPAFLGNDINDPDSLDIRVPGPLVNKLFVGGANGIPESPEFSSELDRAIIGNPAAATGIFQFQNPETFDITLLLIPGNSSGAVIGQGLQLCESRGDCLYIVDPPFGLRPQQVVDWHNGLLFSDLTRAINSSFGALYWSHLKIFDQFNGGEIFIPPSGHVAGVFSRTARETEQWFAPAGLNRGVLLTPLDVEFSPTQGERDLLYGSGNAVNPIVKFPQDGIVVFGQRTLQRKASALDRVNVRMLLIFLRKNLVRLLRNFIFEINDAFTRAQVVAAIEPFLADVQARRGLSGFNVVCDETNNTPERIDRNELHVAVFLKPTRVAEFIVLNLIILRTEASFASEEVLAAGGVVVETTT